MARFISDFILRFLNTDPYNEYGFEVQPGK